MVAAGHLKFLPVSYLFEPPRQMPMLHSDDRFASTLPSHLMSFWRENSVVRTLTKSGSGFRVEEYLRPCRQIDIRYKDDQFLHGHFGQLFEQRVESIKENLVRFSMRLPDEPPLEPHFQAWVEQSINKAAWRTHAQIVEEVRIANCLSARYITTSSFVHKLLQLATAAKESDLTSPVSVVLNIPLPCLPDVDIQTLMRVRNQESDAFEIFRAEINKRLGALRSISDSDELRRKGEIVMRELTESEVPKIEIAIKNLRKTMLSKLATIAGTLAATGQSHGFTLPLLGAAVASGYASYSEYRSRVVENPAFFLWKVTKKR